VDLYPAIDLRGGRVVQLVQGDFGRETVHGDDPAAVARAFEAAGAPWIHVVDLDAARTGAPTNRDQIAAVVRAVSVPVQVGGGVRDEAQADWLFSAGVTRAVVGTASVTNPQLVERLAARHRIAVGLDVWDREILVKGWAERSGVDLFEALPRFEAAGVDAVVVTQVRGEGLMQGPDVEGLAAILAASPLPLVASGGVSSLADLAALAALEAAGRRLDGVIVGTALYEGRFTAREACAALAGP
jgi:phosphoribosylformimino-5-aminoimidazole carboxamide ribotide isomerase